MPLIDTDTAAYATGLTPRTIQRLVKAGTLTNHAPGQGRGHPIRLDLDEVLAHTDPHHVASTQQGCGTGPMSSRF